MKIAGGMFTLLNALAYSIREASVNILSGSNIMPDEKSQIADDR
jgi:hypothetical protein